MDELPAMARWILWTNDAVGFSRAITAVYCSTHIIVGRKFFRLKWLQIQSRFKRILPKALTRKPNAHNNMFVMEFSGVKLLGTARGQITHAHTPGPRTPRIVSLSVFG
jgi:hypothetical protein